MRRPRRLLPGQVYDVTIRTHHGRFRFLPTKERRERLGFFIAKCKAKYPELGLLAVVQMSNHIHLIFWDRASQLADFMRDFESQLAKSINRLDKVRGAVFERRYAAIPIVDVACLVKRIAYAVTNPVAAGLVRSHKDWTGLVGWFGDFQPETFTYFHEGKYKKACKEAEKTGEYVPRSDFEEHATLELDPFEHLDANLVAEAIAEREKMLYPKNPSILGMRRVLQQKPFERPKWSKRSKMSLCLYTKRDAKNVFFDAWFRFVEQYRAASDAFRAGNLTVKFPLFSFRPSTPSSA